jgi:hypothetical protein
MGFIFESGRVIARVLLLAVCGLFEAFGVVQSVFGSFAV